MTELHHRQPALPLSPNRPLAFETHMRIDLYLHQATRQAILGKVTPTSDGGRGDPRNGDRTLGELWDSLIPSQS